MKQYWYLCARTGIIKYAGKFADFDECNEFLCTTGKSLVWIFTKKPIVEDESE